jgi:hypothetical protein
MKLAYVHIGGALVVLAMLAVLIYVLVVGKAKSGFAGFGGPATVSCGGAARRPFVGAATSLADIARGLPRCREGHPPVLVDGVISAYESAASPEPCGAWRFAEAPMVASDANLRRLQDKLTLSCAAPAAWYVANAWYKCEGAKKQPEKFFGLDPYRMFSFSRQRFTPDNPGACTDGSYERTAAIIEADALRILDGN